MDFKDKVIWITGASSGIGEALALAWAGTGARLILSGRNPERLQAITQECIKMGAECTPVAFDLADETSIKEAARLVREKFSAIHILVNNGGVSQRSWITDTPVEVDRKIMEANFFGAVTLTKEVLPVMIRNGYGHIVIISSVVGKFGFPMRSAYSASKHALQGYFDSLRAELGSRNIYVTLVSPGRIKTNISLNALNREGEKHGVMDPGQARGIPAGVCAKKIIKAVYKKRKDILIAREEVLMVFFRRFLPCIYYRLSAKVKPT